jgi:hypothetical protein
MYTRVMGSRNLYPGAISASSDAIPLSTNLTDISEVIIQSSTGNAVNVYVGTAVSRPLFILPGASLTLPVQNLNSVYVSTTGSTASVGYLGRD